MTTAALVVFYCGIPDFELAPGGIQFAGPNTFVPGVAAICLIGVALGVVGLHYDRKKTDR
jgi:hypothetical protein